MQTASATSAASPSVSDDDIRAKLEKPFPADLQRGYEDWIYFKTKRRRTIKTYGDIYRVIHDLHPDKTPQYLYIQMSLLFHSNKLRTLPSAAVDEVFKYLYPIFKANIPPNVLNSGVFQEADQADIDQLVTARVHPDTLESITGVAETRYRAAYDAKSATPTNPTEPTKPGDTTKPTKAADSTPQPTHTTPLLTSAPP